MVDNPVLGAIRRSRERSMANAICLFTRILVENRVRVLAPVARVHRVVANELELTETVVAVIRAGGAVDEEGLVGDGVD